MRPGTRITLTVWRKGTTREIAVTVVEMREDAATPQLRRGAPAPKEKAKPNRMGLILNDLTDEQRKELDLKSGVLVEDVVGTVRGNVQPGDVILAIIQRGQATEAKSAAQVNDLLGQAGKGLGRDAAAAPRRQPVLRDAQARQRRVSQGLSTGPTASRRRTRGAMRVRRRATEATTPCSTPTRP